MATMNAHWLVRTRLKTRHLLLLVALDNHRNMRRAAETLAMSQPALSKLLLELEEALDVTLFERHSKGLSPTWYGDTFIRHARSVLATLDKAHEEIHNRRSGLSGVVNLGTIVGPTVTLLPNTLQKMNQHFPNVQLRVAMDLSHHLLEQLSSDKLDLVVGRFMDEGDQTPFQFERLGSEPLALVVRQGHPLAQKKKLQLDQLIAQSWVLPPGGGALRHQFDLVFKRQGLPPPVHGVETLSLSLMTDLLLSSDMVAILASSVADMYVKHRLFAYLPLPFQCEISDYGLITRKNAPLSASAQAFVALLKEEARSQMPQV